MNENIISQKTHKIIFKDKDEKDLLLTQKAFNEVLEAVQRKDEFIHIEGELPFRRMSIDKYRRIDSSSRDYQGNCYIRDLIIGHAERDEVERCFCIFFHCNFKTDEVEEKNYGFIGKHAARIHVLYNNLPEKIKNKILFLKECGFEI